MRTTTAALLSLVLSGGLYLAAQPASAAPAPGTAANEPRAATPSDNLPNPLADKQASLRQEAVAAVLEGDAETEVINGNTVVKVGREPVPGARAASARSRSRGGRVPTQDQYVELENERTDRVFVLLVEFGDERHPDFPDEDVDPSVPGPTTYEGPEFNKIPEPGPQDNSTQWRPDYTPEYYDELYFGEGEGVESLKTYYEAQSSGRYSVAGEPTEFVRVRYNEARYGRPFEGTFEGVGCSLDDIVCSNTWELVRDGMNQWVADQQAAGLSDAEIAETLASYDVVDRYDYDGDGDFDEPDGYVDKFQVVHAGGDQADGDPIQGEDAIWSHRWYAYYTGFGSSGPANFPAGGTEIGDTGFWVGDYTIQPENGGLSVVAHEYGHDLDLPDHYDTQASGDNPVSWWTLMAQSRVSDEGDQGIGTRAADLSAWDKLQLGWLDYEIVAAGKRRTLVLGPHEYNSRQAQAVAVVLPDKQLTTPLPAPPEGTRQWWSGSGDSYSASMSRADLAVPAGGAQLDLQAAYNIEEDFDYAWFEVEDPAGSGTWTQLPTSAIDPDDGNDGDEPGIDGVSDGYVSASYDLTPYAGRTIGFRVRYLTDGAVQGQDGSLGWSGIFVDDIRVTAGGETVFADGAENPPNGWALAGFESVGGSLTTDYDHFYLASNRQYVSYDRYLRTGPYNFGFPDRPDFAEHFPYQDGLLVSYWDTSYRDNNTSQHPGRGMILPVDARPRVFYNLEGTPWRGRIQTYDAPFGLQRADSFTLHVNGKPSYLRGLPANPVFDDSDPDRYFRAFRRAGLPRVGVKVAGAGVQIRVLGQRGTRMRVRVS